MSLNRTFDRCDASGISIDQYENHIKVSCQAEALVRVSGPTGGTLDFCGHDYAKHEAALLLQGWIVAEDNRSGLTEHNRLVGSHL